MTPHDNAIAVLRIELEHIEPLIWRRVAVRTSIKLGVLHKVVQATMGWLDHHLWQFTADERRYSMLIPDDPDWNERIINAATIKLSTLLAKGINEIGYVYDFGDNWEHRIAIESIKLPESKTLYPQLLGGERRCPPEDCGGIPGYYDFIDNITGKQSKERKAALEWYGGSYDPRDIDEEEITIALKRIGKA